LSPTEDCLSVTAVTDVCDEKSVPTRSHSVPGELVTPGALLYLEEDPKLDAFVESQVSQTRDLGTRQKLEA
jgi:hypothetical protein